MPSQPSNTAAGMIGLRTYSPTARKTLEAAFTTVRNVGADAWNDVGLRQAIEQHKVPGPRVVTTWQFPDGVRIEKAVDLIDYQSHRTEDYAHEIRITRTQRFDLRTGHVVDPLA